MAKFHTDNTLNAKTINFLLKTQPLTLHTPPGKRLEESFAQEEKPEETDISGSPRKQPSYITLTSQLMMISSIRVHKASHQLSVPLLYVKSMSLIKHLRKVIWNAEVDTNRKKHLGENRRCIERRQYQQSIINILKEIKENIDIGLIDNFLVFVWV